MLAGKGRERTMRLGQLTPIYDDRPVTPGDVSRSGGSKSADSKIGRGSRGRCVAFIAAIAPPDDSAPTMR